MKRTFSPEELRVCADALDFDGPTFQRGRPPQLGPIAQKRRTINRRKDERAKPWHKAERGTCMCYFIGGEEGPVKIGHTRDLLGRLAMLQLGSPVELRLLAAVTGGEAAEAEYHARFADCRLHREWFERTPELVTEIAKLNREAAE